MISTFPKLLRWSALVNKVVRKPLYLLAKCKMYCFALNFSFYCYCKNAKKLLGLVRIKMTKSVQIIWNQTDQRLKLGKENKTKNKNVIWIKSNLFRAMHLWFNLFKDIVEYESIYFWWDIFVVVTHWSSYSALKLRPIVNRTTNIDGFLTGHECIIIK